MNQEEEDVQVLEALVKQGKEIIKDVTPGPWDSMHIYRHLKGFERNQGCDCEDDNEQPLGPVPTFQHGMEGGRDPGFIAKARSLVPGLVEVAEATLEQFKYWETDGERDVYLCACAFLHAQAEKLKPRMIECGMEVPK